MPSSFFFNVHTSKTYIVGIGWGMRRAFRRPNRHRSPNKFFLRCNLKLTELDFFCNFLHFFQALQRLAASAETELNQYLQARYSSETPCLARTCVNGFSNGGGSAQHHRRRPSAAVDRAEYYISAMHTSPAITEVGVNGSGGSNRAQRAGSFLGDDHNSSVFGQLLCGSSLVDPTFVAYVEAALAASCRLTESVQGTR
jgi:hypothetical protein